MAVNLSKGDTTYLPTEYIRSATSFQWERCSNEDEGN